MDESLFAEFDQVERTHWWFTARREIVLAVAGHHVPAGGRILDVGCGTGFFLESARQRYDAFGVDPSSTAVTLCRRRGLHSVSQASAYDLSTVDGTFQAIFFLDVIEHLDDDLRALREAYEHLAPGGVVVITVPAFMFLWSSHDVVNQHRRRYRKRPLDELLRRAGFMVEQLTYFNFFLFPLAVGQRLVSRIGRQPAEANLRLPRPQINSLMRRIFESEKRRLARRGSPRGYPFGLSLLAVARRAA